MTLTGLSPSARSGGRVRSALSIPVVRAEGDRTVVVLRGEADFSTRAVLADALSRVIALSSGEVVLDLADMEFVDSATVRVLAMAQQLLDWRGRKLTFRSPSRLAVRVLALFDLTDLIETPEPSQV